MTADAQSYDGPGSSPLDGRPPGQLHDYPLQFRWEATRRHPYYQTFWQHAQRYRGGDMGKDANERLLRYAGVQLLGVIDVYGEPVSPERRFEELDDSVDPTFLSGAIQPLSLRATVAMLISALPKAERAFVGALLSTSSSPEYALPDDDDTQSMQKRLALLHLLQTPSVALDSHLDAPLFYIHLGASQRTIIHDIEEQVRRRKARLEIEERRVHTTKLQSYLDVWDLREGWSDHGYDRTTERSLVQTAEMLNIESTSTVFNRYKAAFQLITGHEFSPQLWLQLFGPLRLGDSAERFSRRVRYRLQSQAESQSVPTLADSVLSPKREDEHSPGVVESRSEITDDTESRDFMIDFRDFVERDLSDAEIARRLEIRDVSIVPELRARLSEFSDY